MNDWPVSTGRSGFGTPSGVYHPQQMARRWFSRKYDKRPAPYADRNLELGLAAGRNLNRPITLSIIDEISGALAENARIPARFGIGS